MNRFAVRKTTILLVLFVLSVIFLIFQSLRTLNSNDHNIMIYLFLESGAFALVGISITFVIILKGYSSLKKLFYNVPIFMIRRAIRSSSALSDNIISNYIVCSLLNFWCLYFLSITPVSSILSKIFEFDFVQKGHLDYTLFSTDMINKISNLELFVSFTIMGVIIINVLRCLYHRHNPRENKYPGANALLAFSYTMFAFMIIQGFILYEGGNTSLDDMRNYQNVLSLGVNFSFLDIFAVMIVGVLDKFLIKSFLDKS